MYKTFKYLTALLFVTQTVPAQERFVSLTLCSDRLLIELARPEQIAAMSPYSQKPLMMLDKVNRDKPVVEPKLTDLLPYLDKTFFINERFYPQLTAALKKLGVNVIPLNDTPQTPAQLFELIEYLGEITDNRPKATALIERLKSKHFKLNPPLAETLILTDTGVAETQLFVQYHILLELLGLKPLKTTLSAQHFSLEKLVLSQPNILITLTDKQGYNDQAELLTHPILQNYFKNRPLAAAPLKYTYCFDHGVWQGAEILYHQLKAFNEEN